MSIFSSAIIRIAGLVTGLITLGLLSRVEILVHSNFATQLLLGTIFFNILKLGAGFRNLANIESTVETLSYRNLLRQTPFSVAVILGVISYAWLINGDSPVTLAPALASALISAIIFRRYHAFHLRGVAKASVAISFIFPISQIFIALVTFLILMTTAWVAVAISLAVALTLLFNFYWNEFPAWPDVAEAAYMLVYPIHCFFGIPGSPVEAIGYVFGLKVGDGVAAILSFSYQPRAFSGGQRMYGIFLVVAITSYLVGGGCIWTAGEFISNYFEMEGFMIGYVISSFWALGSISFVYLIATYKGLAFRLILGIVLVYISVAFFMGLANVQQQNFINILFFALFVLLPFITVCWLSGRRNT